MVYPKLLTECALNVPGVLDTSLGFPGRRLGPRAAFSPFPIDPLSVSAISTSPSSLSADGVSRAVSISATVMSQEPLSLGDAASVRWVGLDFLPGVAGLGLISSVLC